MASKGLIRLTSKGLYCETGGFYIDPWKPVDRAVITHAHADHAYRGNKSYLVARPGEHLYRARLGDKAHIETAAYGAPLHINGVRVSFHPAGHVLGSAQVRVEHKGEVWVVSGDYNLTPDPTCEPFEHIRSHHFITEATFGLPIYKWRPMDEVFAEVNAWWRANRDRSRASVIFAYSLGKAQRTALDPRNDVAPTLRPAFGRGWHIGSIELAELSEE